MGYSVIPQDRKQPLTNLSSPSRRIYLYFRKRFLSSSLSNSFTRSFARSVSTTSANNTILRMRSIITASLFLSIASNQPSDSTTCGYGDWLRCASGTVCSLATYGRARCVVSSAGWIAITEVGIWRSAVSSLPAGNLSSAAFSYASIGEAARTALCTCPSSSPRVCILHVWDGLWPHIDLLTMALKGILS
jgi:hypothetical protein